MRSVEINAVLVKAADSRGPHSLLWQHKIELTLDCFICGRVGRTVVLNWGDEQALCTSDQKRGPHPTAARVAGFDQTAWDARKTLRAVVDYWWAPFRDPKRDQPAMPLTAIPWVRLHYDVLCHASDERMSSSTQTNEGRPNTRECKHCGEPTITSLDAPAMRLL